MIYSITDRDDDAARMKVCWKKMDNFLRTFALDYFRAEKEFADGKYGSDWPFRRWLLLKVGVAEDSVLTALKAREHALADAQREERDRAADEGRRAKYAAKYVEQQQREAVRASDAAEKAEKERRIKEAENVAEFLGDYTEAQKAEIIDRYFNREESEIVITQAMGGNVEAKAASVKVVRVIAFEIGRRADELARLGVKIKPQAVKTAPAVKSAKPRRNGRRTAAASSGASARSGASASDSEQEFPKTLKAAENQSKHQWELGDALLDECGPPSRDGAHDGSSDRIAQAAECLRANGHDFAERTLREYRSLSYLYPPGKRLPGVSWSVHQVVPVAEWLKEFLAAQPLSRKKVKLTVAQAKELVNARAETPVATSSLHDEDVVVPFRLNA